MFHLTPTFIHEIIRSIEAFAVLIAFLLLPHLISPPTFHDCDDDCKHEKN